MCIRTLGISDYKFLVGASAAYMSEHKKTATSKTIVPAGGGVPDSSPLPVKCCSMRNEREGMFLPVYRIDV